MSQEQQLALSWLEVQCPFQKGKDMAAKLALGDLFTQARSNRNN